jgi:hypothetical protein
MPRKKYSCELTPTQNFYNELFGELPEHDVDEADIPELVVILYDELYNRESETIIKWFGIGCEKMSQAGIAREFSLSDQRIGQMIIHALHRLQHPTRSGRIKFLFKSRAELRGQIAELQDRNWQLLGEVNRLKSERARIQGDLKRCVAGLSSHITEEYGADAKMTIEEMDFTIRTFNVLKRAGINTLADLMDRSLSDLMKARNMGRKGLVEIECKMIELGTQLKDDDHE